MQSKAPTDLKKAPVKDVNLNLPVCRGGGGESRMMRQSEALCVFKPFSALLLHVLSKTALLSAPQAVRCEVWSEWGGGSMCEKREGTKEEGEGRGEGRGEGGGEDDGTGVEFTHPAGSAYYWHTCFSVMSHPCYGESERKCGFLSE